MLYEPLTIVDNDYEGWRRAVVSVGPDDDYSLMWTGPGREIVQANTLVKEHGRVALRVYDESKEGIVQRLVERTMWINCD